MFTPRVKGRGSLPMSLLAWMVLMFALVSVAPAQQPAKPAASKKPLVKLRIANTSPQLTQFPMVWAKQAGYFAEEGFDAEVFFMKSDADALRAILAGEAQCGEFNAPGIIQAISQGGAVKIVSSTNPKVTHVLAVRKDINSLADLQGKALAISGPGSLMDVLNRAVFEEMKVDIKKVSLLAVGATSDRYKALIAEKVQAAPLPGEWTKRLQNEPNYKILFKYRDIIPKYVMAANVVSEKWIHDHPDQVVGFIRAKTKAARDFYDLGKTSAIADLESRRLGVTREELMDMIEYYRREELIAPNGFHDSDAILYTQDWNVKLGSQKAALPIDRIANWKLEEAALASLGEFKISK